MKSPCSLKIISGGQTGADRAALDFALSRGIPHGGWCPRDRLAEDGPLAPHYELKETPDADPAQRTEWNVCEGDATVIFSVGDALRGGSALTAETAKRLRKPWLHVSESRDGPKAVALLSDFLARYRCRVLNVAGPRASEEPEVGRFVQQTLEHCPALTASEIAGQ